MTTTFLDYLLPTTTEGTLRFPFAGPQRGDVAVVRTPDSLYLGFGLEGIAGPGTRQAVMGRAIQYLLR